MLETLQERLARVTKTLRGEGHLTEYHVESALREIRLALLEADVSVEVVTRFIDRVRERVIRLSPSSVAIQSPSRANARPYTVGPARPAS
jgi:signal recognition particle subunit SRP54